MTAFALVALAAGGFGLLSSEAADAQASLAVVGRADVDFDAEKGEPVIATPGYELQDKATTKK